GFDVRGVIQLGSKSVKWFPEAVRDIKVGQKCRSFHFLHAAQFTGFVTNRTQIGSYTVHYASGRHELIPIQFGRDVRDWWMNRDEPIDPDSKAGSVVAWLGMSPAAKVHGVFIRIFKTTWKNLLPNEEIKGIDFVSSGADSAPFLMALTL